MSDWADEKAARILLEYKPIQVGDLPAFQPATMLTIVAEHVAANIAAALREAEARGREEAKAACLKIISDVRDSTTQAAKIAGQDVGWDADMIDAGIAAAIKALV